MRVFGFADGAGLDPVSGFVIEPLAGDIFIWGDPHTVQPFHPGRPNSGQWRCETHKDFFRNNLEASFHEEEGQHYMAWFCFEHEAFEQSVER